MEKLEVKSYVQYRQEILAALKQEGIDVRVFLNSTLPIERKMQFQVRLASFLIQLPEELFWLGYPEQAIREAQLLAEFHKEKVIEWARNVWTQLTKEQ